jgi:hypothetical protein
MTALSSIRRAREPSDSGNVAAGHPPVVVSQAPAPPYSQRRQRSRPAMEHGDIDQCQKQRHCLACPMAQRRHPLVA